VLLASFCLAWLDV